MLVHVQIEGLNLLIFFLPTIDLNEKTEQKKIYKIGISLIDSCSLSSAGQATSTLAGWRSCIDGKKAEMCQKTRIIQVCKRWDWFGVMGSMRYRRSYNICQVCSAEDPPCSFCLLFSELQVSQLRFCLWICQFSLYSVIVIHLQVTSILKAFLYLCLFSEVWMLQKWKI